MSILSAANAIQAKTSTVDSQQTVSVTLDNPTRGGGSVIVEMYGPILWPGMPDGWEYDCALIVGSPLYWAFRRSPIPAGEQSWDWTDPIGARVWAWRVTEWDTMLDPIGPYETYQQNSASGASVATLSTGTTPTTNRAEVVCLASHITTHQASAPGMTLNFSDHTNGFVERDEARLSLLSQELDVSWSWLFAEATGTFECTATVNNSAPDAADSYYSLIAVYAASQPITVPSVGQTTMVG